MKIHCYLLFTLSWILTHPLLSATAEPILEDVSVAYKDADTFKRISEYFTGVENQGRRTILRSQESERAGLYWVIELDKALDQLPFQSTIDLQYVIEGSPELHTQSFNLLRRSSSTLYLGLTGSDWADEDQEVVAWKLVLKNAEGQTIEQKQSFLWEYPS